MTGRIAVFHDESRPIELVSAPVPEPRNGEVLVRVDCCTLCRSDLHTHAGRRTGPSPTVLGHEIVGKIAALGHEVPSIGLKIGDRVTWCITVGCGHCFYCENDLPQKCERSYKYGHERFTRQNPFCGGLADYQLLVPGTTLCLVPDNLPDTQAAMASCATSTALAVARVALGELAGKTVLILGAGVLGLSACAWAHRHGATVIVSDPVQPERATSFGATHTVSANAFELAARIGEVTHGRGMDQSWELAGAVDSVANAIQNVRIGGTVVLAGTVLPVPAYEMLPEQVVRRMLTIRGVHNYAPTDLSDAISFLAEAQGVYPWQRLLGPSFGLQDIDQAFAYAHAHPGVRVAVKPAEG